MNKQTKSFTDDWHASVIAYLLQLLGEISQSIFTHCPLRSETGNGPDTDFHAGEELLAAHIPDTLIRQCLLFGSSPILKFRWRKYTTTHFHHTKEGIGKFKSIIQI